MAEKKGGLINRLIMGSEKSETYARASLPSNRWELFWDILKGRLGKLFIINLLMLIFFIPLVLVIIMKNSMLSFYGSENPFSQSIGIGYPVIPSLQGLTESITLQTNSSFYLLLFPVATLIASIGVAGGAYVIRNMVWTEGIFVANDFWRGIRLNIKIILQSALFFSVLFFIAMLSLSSADVASAGGRISPALLVITKGVTYVGIVFLILITMYLITMGVTYNLSFFKLLRNAVLFTVALLPQNLFFALLSLLPFLLFILGGIFSLIGGMLIFFLGGSLCLLIWTDFSHYGFDKFINDKIEGAEKNRGIYEKVSSNNSEAMRQYKEQMIMSSLSTLTTRPIKPITDKELALAEIPATFNRADLQRLQESKEAIAKDAEDYIELHKNDEKYQLTEEQKQFEKEKQERLEKAKHALENAKGKKKRRDKK